MLERLAASARDLVVRAQEEARALGHPAISDDHLLLALTGDAGPAGTAMRDAGATHQALAAQIPAGEAHTSGQVPFAPAARRVLEDAAGLAGAGDVQAEHVAQALTRAPAWALTGLDAERLRATMSVAAERLETVPPVASAEPQSGLSLPPEPWFRPPG